MTKKFNAFFVFVASFLFMLPYYNKGWAPYDEGNYLTTALLASDGLIPYRDFLLVMYPPGHAYTLGALLKIFGMNLMVGRIYNIVLLSIICTCVFLITKKISSKKLGLIAFVACLITMASLGEPPIPRAIWPGVAWSMVAVVFIIDYIQKESLRYLVFSGFFIALAAIYRHDIGALTFIAGAIGILLHKRSLRVLAVYAALPSLAVLAFILWLYKVGALKDAFEAMVVLPSLFNKWGAIPFPPFCFDFGMIFHRGCIFIKHNKFYIPIIICAASAILYITSLIAKKRLDKKDIPTAVLLSLGILYLQQLVFRVDSNHLAVSFPPSAVLFGLMFTYVIGRGKFLNAIKIILLSYVSLLMILFIYINLEKYVKDIYIKPFVKKSIAPVAFRRGTIYLPDDVRETFVSLVKYVEANTRPGEKIYIGHLRHKVPQMGWFDLIYFLTDRRPAVKQYVMIPGFQSRDDIQDEMARSLKDNDTRLVLLRDFGETDELGPLDRYIRAEYKLEKIIGSYHIYVKK